MSTKERLRWLRRTGDTGFEAFIMTISGEAKALISLGISTLLFPAFVAFTCR
jgi:hypothetical protein